MTDKILIDRSVLEQALDTLEMMGTPSPLVFLPDEIKSWQAVQAALRAALEQPQVEQEPVAYFYTASGRIVSTEATENLMQQMTGEPGKVPLYLHQQPQVEQDPYLWYDPVRDQFWNQEDAQYIDMSGTIPLYINPQPPHQPLDGDEIHRLWDEIEGWFNFARAIEAAHGIGG